ncbi:hypothetical protein AMQ83_32650 [Paenibacillus riograndensis]|nr:hypothetical protein AMQ83_32650 [Paenibacillus riograndensis]
MERLYLRGLRDVVDKKYIGFKPNGSSVKPVHIYNGASRIIYGKSADTEGIKKLSYVSNAKGKVPPANLPEKVLEYLIEKNAIEHEDIDQDELASFRSLLQNLLSADDGVFSGTDDSMVSYSAGSKYFITRNSLYEDAGEFIGGLIKQYCAPLSNYIHDLLEAGDDPITILFEPVIKEETDRLYDDLRHQDIEVFRKESPALLEYLDGLKKSGECLLAHLQQHPNPLTQLRLFNFFCSYNLIRYLSLLEAFYNEVNTRPILLDFSEDSQSSIARASVMSYTQINRSISRFYAWCYAQELKCYTKEELLSSPAPAYEPNNKSKVGEDELLRMWELAKSDATNASDEEARLIFGASIYDMLALEGSSHPISYLRALGVLAGILYPPTNFHVNKRFALSQDALEMVIRSCIAPSEVISSNELRVRLWERIGVIIGGTDFEIKKLHEAGSILQADSDSLNQNFERFASTLEAMNFAEIMADGILQIRLGGSA